MNRVNCLTLKKLMEETMICDLYDKIRINTGSLVCFRLCSNIYCMEH